MMIKHKKIQQRGILTAAVCLYLSAASLSSTFAASSGVLPTEPTISAKEAALLERAAAVAATNRLEAVKMLHQKQNDKASSAIDFAVGNFLFQADKLQDAEAAYLKAVEKLPTFRNALKNLGRVYLQMEREDDAIRVYQTLVEKGLADADSLLLLGHALMMREHFVAAENAFRQTLLLKPKSYDAQQGLIKCLLEQERYPEARSLLKTMLDTKPQSPELWNLLANVNMALDANQKAITALETADRLNCSSAAMQMLLGDLYLDAGQASDAVARYDAAVKRGWTDKSRLLRAAEGLVMIGDAQRARQMLTTIENSRTQDGSSSGMLTLKADLAALEGNSDEAIKIYRQIITTDPLNGRAILKLGELLQAKGDTGAAQLNYERASRLKGTEAEALVKQAQLAVQNNHFDRAVTLLESAQTIEPHDNVARYLKQLRRMNGGE
jgi:tetratricopeptide (TPR) repeat protein